VASEDFMSLDAQTGQLNIFKGPKYYVFERSETTVGIVVLNSSRIANRLNTNLTLYPKDTLFTDQDEPLFIVPKSKMALVSVLLGIKHLPVWLR
jgi:hypothetical protein